jgi:hypothetical protein
MRRVDVDVAFDVETCALASLARELSGAAGARELVLMLLCRFPFHHSCPAFTIWSDFE